MKTQIAALAALLLFSSFAAAADTLHPVVLEPGAGDLVPTQLGAASKQAVLPPQATEPVQFSWKLEADASLELPPPALPARSREYRLQVDGTTLSEGVELATVASGALIRINPEQEVGSNAAYALHGHNLLIITPDEKQLAAEEAAEALATAEQLKSAGAPFAPGTTALRLRSDLGPGRYILKAPELPRDDTRYLIHVFEVASELEAELATERNATLAGQSLEARLDLHGLESLKSSTVKGWVVAPSGERRAIDFTGDASSGFSSQITLDHGTSGHEGLWEIHGSVHGLLDHGLEFRRDVRIAFACADPTARLLQRAVLAPPARSQGHARHELAQRPLQLELEVAEAGRYELRGVLYGSNAEGQMIPAAMAHSAAWLDAGVGQIELVFSPRSLAGCTLQAPYEIRDLQLLDQARMGLLQRQARAIVIK